MATTARTNSWMTAHEFRHRSDIPDYAELIFGEVVIPMTPPSRAHTRIARAIFVALYAHAAPRGLGEVYQDMAGYELPNRDDTVVLPDASFVHAGREPAEVGTHGFPRLAPDLAVEVLSDSDRRAAIRRKLAAYLDAGTTLVWLLDPENRTVEVHAPDALPRRLGEGEVLDGGAVLPEFTVAVAELFRGVARGG